jgi:hypothetical protein
MEHLFIFKSADNMDQGIGIPHADRNSLPVPDLGWNRAPNPVRRLLQFGHK